MRVLKASAGSGKTFNLAGTYIRLLMESEDRYAYRHILAVTFTNKATSEMKSRILRDLGKLAETDEKARLTVSPDRIHGRRLETQQSKGGIPRLTPHDLTAMLLSLPPILYMNYRISVLSCSKAPWGLSV